ncbi:MAG: hypothetical protein QW341_04790 [Candidatus Bathyarchaeia archaeon]
MKHDLGIGEEPEIKALVKFLERVGERASAAILKDEFSENSEWMKILTANECRKSINCFQLWQPDPAISYFSQLPLILSGESR